MKLIIGLFLLLLAVLAAIVLSQGYLKNGSFSFGKKTTVTINNQKFNVSVAKTDQERQAGLSGKTSLDQNAGMLFIFEKPDLYSFWSKDMKFPIDIIYINNDTIVTIVPNVTPPSVAEDNPPIITPEEPADKVLEINGGLSEKYAIKKGDKVTIENL